MVWRNVKAANAKTPYEYETKEEAEKMLRICYGAALEASHMRVVKGPKFLG
jgi:hypothetical protein